jgi:hypothetical protein
MQALLEDKSLLYPETDKGLGPCAVTYDQYVEDGLIHLRNQECYAQLSEEEALLATDVLETDILNWLKKYKHCIEDMSRQYIENHMKSVSASPFGQFYILYKMGAGLLDQYALMLQPRPYGLDKWVNDE